MGKLKKVIICLAVVSMLLAKYSVYSQSVKVSAAGASIERMSGGRFTSAAVNYFQVAERCTMTLYCETDLTSKIKWSSGNTKIATVDKNGVVTGVKAGKTVITATIAANGQKVTKTVKVLKNQYKDSVSDTLKRETDTVSYDKDGNLLWKITFKNVSLDTCRCALSNELSVNGEKVKSINWKFTLKKGKSKSKIFKIPKAKLKGMVYDFGDEMEAKCHVSFISSVLTR